MPLTDEELLTFDQRVDRWSRANAERLLNEMPDLYRNQLTIAKFIDGWVRRLENHSPAISEEYQAGVEWGVRQTAAYLRQGDLVPGGQLYDETEGSG